jgi:hypothetical protein
VTAVITVSPRADGTFAVEVIQEGRRTEHLVSVPPGFAARLGAHGVGEEQLVRASFEFLLEREPASSILGRFGLEVIGRYFPDYDRDMARRLAGGPQS